MRWHTADFDTLDWHGVHVHGWRIVERGPGEADLALDIDWILDRPLQAGAFGAAGSASAEGSPPGAADGYLVAQAMLVFHEVAGLRFVLDYASCSAASGAFCIERVHRRPLTASAGRAQSPDASWHADAGERDAEGQAEGRQVHQHEDWQEDQDENQDENQEEDQRDDYGPWRWRIDVAWPEGELAFEASGFSQWLVGEPQTVEAPLLPAALRS